MTNENNIGTISGKVVGIDHDHKFFVCFGVPGEITADDYVRARTWDDLVEKVEARIKAEATSKMSDLNLPVIVPQGGAGTWETPEVLRIKGIHAGHKKVIFYDLPGQFRGIFYPDTPEARQIIAEFGKAQAAYNAADNRLRAIALRGERGGYASASKPLTQLVEELETAYQTAVQTARSLADAS